MAELEIVRYSPEMKREWDEFISRSKNGTFLLRREYMDYHSDRFSDHSLLFLKGGSIQAVMPACQIGPSLVAHAGLTYGGYIMSRKATTEDTLNFFFLLRETLQKEGFSELRVKPVPHIYHTIPAEEDLYALFRLNAQLTVRNVSATISRQSMLPFRSIRKSGIRKAKANGITVGASDDFPSFWKILEDNLASKYGATPVHTLYEIMALASLFPDNIRLHLACDSNGTPLGGAVIFSTPTTAHTQYISASPHGKETGALDILFDTLVNQTYAHLPYFDFGTSNEDGGKILNAPLIYQKEGFGARAICYDTYSVTL